MSGRNEEEGKKERSERRGEEKESPSLSEN